MGMRVRAGLAAGVVVALALVAVGAEPATQTKTGVVRQVDPAAGTLVVQVARELTFTVDPQTRITEGGAARALADLKVGATVTVVYRFGEGRNRVASQITIAPSAQSSAAPGAGDRRYSFTLHTRDARGTPLQQQRVYWVYRPASLARTQPVPMVLFLAGGAPTMFHRKADQAGFLVVSCSFAGNSTGTPPTTWVNDDPRIAGPEDYDYLTEVIRRVRADEHGGDAFTVGLSKNGHMSLAYACERPDMIRAAASLDEFMGLTSNRPTAPVPVLVFQGTADTNVPYTMVKDTVDAWRAVDGLINVAPTVTYEPAPRVPGAVTQATWRGGLGGTQVALVTIVGGTHTYPQPGVQTGYDFIDGAWAFFSQFVSTPPAQPAAVSPPLDNVQAAGQPASFRVVALGAGTLGYQWQRNGQDIPGATDPWLTLPAVTAADQGASFQAVVRNAAGTATSPAATLTVAPAPAGPRITDQPASLAVTAGQSARFAVSASGTPPLRYQWRQNGMAIPGATEAAHLLPAATPFDSGATFSVQVTDAAGTVTSAPAVLTITRRAGAPIVLASPERQRVLAGQTGGFAVTAWSASPLRYQWQRGTFTGPMLDIPGATGPSYTTGPATLADHHTLLRCLVSNAAGTVASASEMLFVTTDAKAPNAITSPTTAAAQAGAPFRYAITAAGGTCPLSYSAAPLPAGLTLDPATGWITGAPTQVATSDIVVIAANGAGRVSATLRLTVSATPPPRTPEAWRREHFGASATDIAVAGDAADPDGDGLTNLKEYQAGSDPLG